MFQELIKIAEEVYAVDKQLGIRMGKCLQGLGKKVEEHNKDMAKLMDENKKLAYDLKTLKRRLH